MTGRTRMTMLGVAAAVVALLGATACGDSSEPDEAGATESDAAPARGDGGDGDGSSSDAEADAQALVFAECMRENGVDMPDPEPGQQGFFDAFHSTVGSADRSTVEAALEACDGYFPTYSGVAGHGSGDDEDTLALAECLREQGLDVPDNLFEDGVLLDLDQDELAAAFQECRDELVGGGS